MKKTKTILPLAMAACLAATSVPLNTLVSNAAADAETSDSETSEDGYKLVWSDEFDGDTLNRDDWNVELHEKGWVNSELQAYVDEDENIQVKDGNLYINPVKKVVGSEDVSVNTGNMLSNADFSSGMDGWTETISGAQATRSIESGKITYDIADPGTADWNIQIKQNVKLEAGKTYIASYKVKSTKARQIKSGVMNGTDYSWYGGTDPVLADDEEQVVEFEFTMSKDDDDANFYISLGQCGDSPASTITLSDLVVYEAENMLSNADFSSEVDGWTETISGAQATRSIESRKITYDITDPGTADWNIQIKQGIKLEAGKTYVASYKVKSTANRSIKSGVMNGTDYSWYGGKDPVLTADKEETITYEFTMSKNDNDANFYISLGKVADEDTPASVITLSDIMLYEKQTGEKVTKEKIEYTSGRISTQNKQTFTYGKFEARVKVPEGQGYLPAFWLMANDENIYGQWPRCGEIDCMEVMGRGIL